MNRSSEETQGFLAAIASVLALAMTGICIRHLHVTHGMDPLVLAFWRNCLLVLPLFLLLELGFPMLVEIKRSELVMVCFFGLVLALFNYLWTLSVAANGAAIATFLVYSSVPLTALLGWLILKEIPPPGMLPALCSSILGCLLISGTIFGSDHPLQPGGIIVGLGAGVCFSLYSLIGRISRQRGMNSWTLMLYSFGFAALALGIGELFRQILAPAPWRPFSSFFSLGTAWSGWAVLLFLSLGPTLLGYGLYTISLGYLPSAIVNLISTLEPPSAALLAYLILGEVLTPWQVLGAGLIVGGVLLLRLYRYGHPFFLRLRHNVPQQAP